VKYAARALEVASVGAVGAGLYLTSPWLLLVMAGVVGLWVADGLESE
jgi:hypothetical protein